jgi:hypothetical protein
MARYNPEIMQFDDSATGAPRVFGPRTDTSKITKEEVDASLKEASETLGLDPYIEGADVAELFAPYGGKTAPYNASVADQELFVKEGFIPGLLPAKYHKLFGNPTDIIGYKVITNPDGSQQIAIARGQDDEDQGLQFQTFGATFKEDASGVPTPYVPSTMGKGSGVGGAGGTGLKTAEQIAADAAKAQAQGERQSAYDLLYSQFKQYGLEALVEPLKGLVVSGASPSEFTIKLRETDAYKKRFAANQARIQKGLAAISEAEYLGLEDQYQNIMRNYGLPAEYYTRGDMGIQEGFNKFIANDVSAAELEDRVMTAQSRVLNANPEVLASLKAFYPDITNGDILAYTLDPTKGLTDIKRKVTAAEIGGAATQAGLGITGTRAGELTAAGITKAQAQQGFQTVAEVAPRGGQLAEIYKQSPYTQTTAEAEVFGLAGSAEAARQRKKLTSLETAAFGGSAGAGAIARDRAGVL